MIKTLVHKNLFPPSCVPLWQTLRRFALVLFAVAASAPLFAQETVTPVVVLEQAQGGFFVFASDLPFQILKEEEDVSWLDVDRLEGDSMAHQVVQLRTNPDGLASGIYYSAVRINLVTSSGDDHILLPVALRVGEDSTPPSEVASMVPPRYVRLQVDDPTTEVRHILTPGGHYIFEVISKEQERQKLDQLSLSAAGKLAQPYLAPANVSKSYEIVFPWMCLERCGETKDDDVADVAANRDAVNHVSYERYTMDSGQWGIVSLPNNGTLGNPGPWVTEAGLGAWPMVVGSTTSSSVQGMSDQRETIAARMVSAAIANGYEGYCIDVEGFGDATTTPTFVDVMDYLANQLHAQGFKLMVAHATWSTIAPIEDLAATSVDYVATMDPYTSLWYSYIPANYAAIEPHRLIWGFTWDQISDDTQLQMWDWMETEGYNNGVAGAAAWRTPLEPPHPSNSVDYYQGFRDYYPVQAGASCSVTVPSNHWKGEYYANKDLSGSPVMVRDDGSGAINFDWGTSGPSSECGLGVDLYSVRWTRTASFSEGTYRFQVTSDDGVRLYIDGVKVHDAWWDRGATTDTVDVSLTAGNHTVVLEYYENGGFASAKLTWQQISQGGCNASVASNHWKGEYYANKNLAGSPAMVRDDGTGDINFNWGTGGPSSECGLGVDLFSVRWTRTVSFAAGTYRFQITSDDGVRLYIDGTMVHGAWRDRGATTDTVDRYLTAGDHTIVLEYYENGGLASVKLTWQQISQGGCKASVASNHWKGEYYANKDLAGSPVMVRDDGTGDIVFDWGTGGPSSQCGLGVDLFSVRWTRTVSFAAGTYRFQVTSDDGVRLHIDGAKVHDAWKDRGATTDTVDVPLAAGNHTVVLEYYENGGFASAKLTWQQISLGGCSASVASNHWKGEYYANKDLAGSPVMVRDDGSGAINFDWGTGGPSSECGLGVDLYSVRWTRTISFATGTYRFQVRSDDGVRLYVDGAKVHDAWRDRGATTDTVDVPLSAGNHTVVLEYYENGGYASAKLDWGLTGTSPSPYRLLAPVSAGQELTVVHGYNDPLPDETCVIGTGPDHCANQKYGLDLSPSDQNDVKILSPLPGKVGWISGTCLGITTQDTLNLNVCHFGTFSVQVGQQVDRGTVLGNRNTSWIHLSLDDRYRNASKPPVPFTGAHTLEAVSLPPFADTQRNQYNGHSFTSTNGEGGSPPASNLVDDGDAGFILFGPTSYWHRESIGYGGDMYWTYVNGSIVSNKVRWRPQLSGSGNYRVQVFVPRNYATTTSARYKIVANGGSYTATVNQSIYYDQWVTLGTYYFNGSNNGSEYVELTDATGEAANSLLKIGFDAVKWEK